MNEHLIVLNPAGRGPLPRDSVRADVDERLLPGKNDPWTLAADVAERMRAGTYSVIEACVLLVDGVRPRRIDGEVKMVGCSAGRSAGFAPLSRIEPKTSRAAGIAPGGDKRPTRAIFAAGCAPAGRGHAAQRSANRLTSQHRLPPLIRTALQPLKCRTRQRGRWVASRRPDDRAIGRGNQFIDQ